MTKIELLMTALLVVALPAASRADSGFTVQKDVPYLSAERAERMDVYLPPRGVKRPVPAVLLIHGGGWKGGSKADPREQNIASTLASNGYAVFSLDYLLNKGGKGTPVEIAWPQNLYDCKSGVRFLRKEAQRFGIDPEKIAVMGESAGAHLAMLVGVTSQVAELNQGGLYIDQKNGVSCIIDFYGRDDVQKDRLASFAGATEAETLENARRASPVTYLDKSAPPFLIVQGSADTLVPPIYSQSLAQRLQELGVKYRYVEIPGVGHAFHLQPKEMDLRPVVLEFLGTYLGTPSLGRAE